MSDLLPCPFCGHTGLIFEDGSTHRWGVASCDGCGATAGSVRRSYTDDGEWRAEAIKAWNHRAQPAQAVPLLTRDEIVSAWLAVEHIVHATQRQEAFARAIEQAVRAKMGAGVGWQPIETAPRGQRVLVWIADKKVDENIAFAKVWFYADGTPGGGAEGFNGKWYLTHWMPLPPPPGIVGKEGA